MRPKVTVIIPVHNTVQYLDGCVGSVVRQTIGADRVEIVAVDDGSTDGSGAELDRLAAEHPALTVVHQEASGGPSRPRNVGLDRASGEFVFFLDSDDGLGTEALERMVAMAERNGADVVLGKMVGTNGRGVPQTMFNYSQARADLFTSAVYNTLNPLKMFRRSLLEEHGIRFPEDIRIGEDQPFVAHAYLHARAISVVADYACYYQDRRRDGSSLMQVGADYFERLRQTEELMELIAAHLEPGPARDRLITRHLRQEVLNRFNIRSIAWPEEQQRRFVAEVEKVLDRWMTDEVRRRMGVPHRAYAYCVEHGLFDELLELVRFRLAGAKPERVTEDGRTYLAYPFFRTGAIPDDCYDVTARRPIEHTLDSVAYADGVVTLRGRAARPAAEGQSVELVLREWETGREIRLPAGGTRFEAAVDLTRVADGGPLPPGLWDVYVAVTAHGTTADVRLGSARTCDPAGGSQTWKVPLDGGAPMPVTAYYTKHGNLSFDVGDVRTGPAGTALTLDDVRWSDRSALVITGRVAARGDAAGGPVGAVSARLTSADQTVHAVTARLTEADGSFTAELPLTTVAGGGPLPAGRWRVTLHAQVGDAWQTVRIGTRPGGSESWRQGGRRFRAEPVLAGRPPALTLRVMSADEAGLLRRVRRRLTDVRGRA